MASQITLKTWLRYGIHVVKSFHNVSLFSRLFILTHWGRVTHICVSDLTSIGSDNSLSPGRRQAIIRTNAGILLIGPLGTNLSEILIVIIIFSFKKMRFKVSSAKRRPFCLSLNVLNLNTIYLIHEGNISNSPVVQLHYPLQQTQIDFNYTSIWQNFVGLMPNGDRSKSICYVVWFS